MSTETGCKAGDECLFPYQKVDEKPNKKAHQRHAVAIVKMYHNWVASRKTRKQWFLQEGNSHGETRCKKSWDRFEKYGSLSLRYVKQVFGKRNDHRLEKLQVKHLHQRSPYAVKFEDRSHEETERHQRCAQAWNLAKNIYKLKEKDQATFYSPAEEWVLLAASTKEPEEREFAVDSGAGMHMVSKRDSDSAELETMRTSRSPTTVMTANGEVQTREKATVHVKELDLFVTVMLLGANHISPQMARESIAIYLTMCHS